MLAQKNYLKILKLSDKHQLLQRDEAFAEKSFYLPSIPWHYAVAAFKTQRLQTGQVRERLLRPLERMTVSNEKRSQLEELLSEIQTHTLELADEIRLLLREKFAASGLKE